MKSRNSIAIIILIAIAGLALAGCAGPGRAPDPSSAEPTMTAIPLPTRDEDATQEASQPVKATEVAEAEAEPTATPSLEPTSSPEPTPEPTLTPSPEPTATTEPTLTPSPEPTLAPSPEPTATKSAPKPKPPAATVPEFEGKLVFQTTIGGDFYTINADGTALQRITDGVDAVWSPDGQQIAYTRWREPRGVWVVDAADPASERRVFDWSAARWPSWSPAGNEILFSRDTGGRPESERCFWGFCFTIPGKAFWHPGFVSPADGSFHEPPAPKLVLAPDWSPDGEQFVYTGEHGLTIQTLDGEVSWQITDDPRDTGPVWSPDGSKVAFTRRQHDHFEVYVVNADGSNLRRLTDTPERPAGEPGNSAAPAWSPDGKHLAFMTDHGGAWQMWVMAASGGGAKPLFDTALDGLTLEYSSVGERAISWTE